MSSRPRFFWPLLFTLFAWLSAAPLVVHAVEPLEGYLGARFGMTQAEVKATFSTDRIEIRKEAMAGGDPFIQARRRVGEDQTDLVYAFTGKEPRLALINVYYPDVTQEKRVVEQLGKRFGRTMDEKSLEPLKKLVEADFGQPPVTLTAWPSDSGKAGRLVRFSGFPAFLVVQYYDLAMMKLIK